MFHLEETAGQATAHSPPARANSIDWGAWTCPEASSSSRESNPPRLVVVEDEARPGFVAFGRVAGPQDDRQRIGLFVVNDFQWGLSVWWLVMAKHMDTA
jgi:hypothetical protein